MTAPAVYGPEQDLLFEGLSDVRSHPPNGRADVRHYQARYREGVVAGRTAYLAGGRCVSETDEIDGEVRRAYLDGFLYGYYSEGIQARKTPGLFR